jgi:hypothetical protein
MRDPPDREVVIFTEALLLPIGESAAYLDRACGSDAELRRNVEALLESHNKIGNFLDHSPQGIALPARTGPSVGEKPGDRIGHFKLLQQIGEGGCGIVFMAEQEHPVRRRVALTVIKPGMDTKSVIARFEAERQALALMDRTVLAMAYWQLGQKEKAREMLAKGETLAPRMTSAKGAVDLEDSWVAWIFARVSLDEATALIQPDSPAGNGQHQP